MNKIAKNIILWTLIFGGSTFLIHGFLIWLFQYLTFGPFFGTIIEGNCNVNNSLVLEDETVNGLIYHGRWNVEVYNDHQESLGCSFILTSYLSNKELIIEELSKYPDDSINKCYFNQRMFQIVFWKPDILINHQKYVETIFVINGIGFFFLILALFYKIYLRSQEKTNSDKYIELK